MRIEKGRLPELLAPAGSLKALMAAIDGGADAVYFGAPDFNARIRAQNFADGELEEAFRLCRAYGVKAYVTLNTLVLDREAESFVRTAEKIYRMGADAAIVADIGGASYLRKYLPELELHASTQMSCHNTAGAHELAKLGFSRVVCARELSYENICRITEDSPVEIEMFVHGALCVSHSGQCLFSSLVGGRSGNRGECAQPCRLPYSVGGKEKYPLSLKDLSLAPYIPQIIDSGVASLKIEGRMKSPEYVRAVTEVYRRLLDEGRGADAGEMKYLASVFSRDGFTDGYFKSNITSKMLGVRREENKDDSRQLTPFDKITRKIPVDMLASFEAGKPCTLTLTCGERSVTITGQAPESAINAPLTREAIEKNLLKLGNTPYSAGSVEISIDGEIMLPLSKVNELRRNAVDALTGSPEREETQIKFIPADKPLSQPEKRTARFLSASQVTKSALEYFDEIYLPAHGFELPDGGEGKVGVIVPAVVTDSENDRVAALIKGAAEKGAKFALVGNLGHVGLARECGLEIRGDFRLNVFNGAAAKELERLGISEFISSPELSLAQSRDVGGSAVVYGRIPLMTVEKCVISEVADCTACAAGKATLTDRKGIKFPVFREADHRNVIYNSFPTYMADREDELIKNRIRSRHFIFSDETPTQVDGVIRRYKEKTPPEDSRVRRIK